MQNRQSTDSVAPSSSAVKAQSEATDQSLVHVPAGPSDLVKSQPSTGQVPRTQSSSWRLSEPFKSFSESPASEPLTNRAIPPAWINKAPTDEWKALMNGCLPFDLQSKQMQDIVETFRRGEGSLTDCIASLAEWKPLTVGAENMEEEVAERDGMYFWRKKGRGVQEFTVTTGVTEQTHRTWDTMLANFEERFEFARNTADKTPSTRLKLLSRSRTSPECFSWWKMLCPDLGGPTVCGGQQYASPTGTTQATTQGTKYIGGPRRTVNGDIAPSFQPSDLKALTQNQCLWRLRALTGAPK